MDQINTITGFIGNLEDLKNKKHPCIDFIKNFKELIENLRELDKLIGMKTFKEQILSLLQFIIVNSYNRVFNLSDSKNLFDNHMINMIFSGPPGCGKTTAAEYLCKIIASLGILHKPQKSPQHSSILPIFEEIQDDRYRLERRKNNRIVESVKKISENLEEFYNEYDDDVDYLIDKYPISKRDKEYFLKQRYKLLRINYELKNSTPRIPNVEEDNNIPFFIYKRSDLVGQYVGQTAIKTTTALEKALGGVVLIDEAYSLYTSEEREDTFGGECLTVIIEFMSRHPNSIIIIFSGYKDKLENTIFRAQPGLKRRIGWTFSIEPYTPKELYEIFKVQVRRFEGWTVEDSPELLSFFVKNKDIFKFAGGDTEKLALYAKNLCYRKMFSKIIEGTTNKIDQVITLKVLEESLHFLKKEPEKKEEISHLYI
jgi:SpoVK/Ycf46/Vps4 family AAA+-type ATPase